MKIVSLTTFVSFQGQSFISANGQIGVYGELGRTTRGVRQECSLQADDVSGEKTYPLFTSYVRHRRNWKFVPYYVSYQHFHLNFFFSDEIFWQTAYLANSTFIFVVIKRIREVCNAEHDIYEKRRFEAQTAVSKYGNPLSSVVVTQASAKASESLLVNRDFWARVVLLDAIQPLESFCKQPVHSLPPRKQVILSFATWQNAF